MKKITILLFLFCSSLIGQNEFISFLNHVDSLQTDIEKQSAADSFINYASSKGIPFIENNSATFLYTGTASSVVVTGDFTGWSSSGKPLNKIVGTNLFHYTQSFESNARLDYKLILNGSNWILDPLNPNRVPGGFGQNSELAMPDYVQPWEIIPDANSVKGKLESKTLASQLMGRTYSVKVYVPNDYSTSTKNYPTVYFQDGSDYLDLARAQTILDNLIHQNKIEKVIAVFVKPTNRNDEYAYDSRNKYAQFFSSELIEFIDTNYRTINDPKKRLVLGDSFGGNISALISYNFPEVFGLCGLHSAAFWPNNYEVYNLIIDGEIKNINYYSVWGTYESLYSNMRSFRDIMLSKGYSFGAQEFPEGHSWGLWRANIDIMLEYFFPYSTVSVKEKNMVNDFYLFQNYPNPFNPTTSIKYSVPHNVKNKTSNVKLVVYDVLGNEIAELVNETQSAGNYQVLFDASNLSSGVYLYKIKVGNLNSSKKMILLK